MTFEEKFKQTFPICPVQGKHVSTFHYFCEKDKKVKDWGGRVITPKDKKMYEKDVFNA